jgi:hypothetical protein
MLEDTTTELIAVGLEGTDEFVNDYKWTKQVKVVK